LDKPSNNERPGFILVLFARPFLCCALVTNIKGVSMKRNLVRLGIFVMMAIFTTIPAFAQAPETSHSPLTRGLGFLAAVIGFGIAAGLCGLGQGRVAAAACEGMARNPGAYNRVQLALILGLALIESLVIFTLVVVLLIVYPNI
jgi:F-type H+-transporting ATPase subunit c